MTVSQNELEELAKLERKAAEFRAKLLARVKAGERVEPGPLSLWLENGAPAPNDEIK